MRASLAAFAAIAAVVAAPAIAWTQGAAAQTPVVAQAETPPPLEALQRMGAYLGTLQSFEMTSDSSIDLIEGRDQRIDLDGVTTYKVRRPNGFVIENRTDRKVRRFIYDGSKFTVYAPTRGFYATADAPPTIKEVLDVAYDRYGIALPLEDLFHWGDPNAMPHDLLSSQYVGPATVDGTQTDQYAFCEDGIGWQIWIRRGDQPLPLKIVIVDMVDPAMPEFSARLSWNLTPRFDDRTFAFTPGGDDVAIPFHQQ